MPLISPVISDQSWTIRDPLRDPPAEWLKAAWAGVDKTRRATPEWIWPAVDFASLPPLPAVAATPLPPPRKYRRLHQWLVDQNAHRLIVSSSRLEELVDGGLPPTAAGNYRNEWWSNNPRKGHVRAWVNAGYVLVDDGDESIDVRVFQRGQRRRISRAEAVCPRLGPLRHVAACSIAPHHRHSSDRPTSVYLLHLPGPGLFKVGISVDPAVRCHNHAGGGRRADLVQVVRAEHRECAFALESVVLNLTEQWRMLDDPWRCGAGATETWCDTGLVPDLAELAERMRTSAGEC